MDQVIQLYPELKLLSCQVGNLSYQDVFYDPRVDINIIPKSLVLVAFPDKILAEYCRCRLRLNLRWCR
jgi:hypothetical protein